MVGLDLTIPCYNKLQARNFHQIIGGGGGGARRTESEFYYFTIS